MAKIIRLTDHARAPIPASTSSSTLPAAPRSGGPSVSQRCTVAWFTPKRSANAAWDSPRRSRAALTISGVIDMRALCIAHSNSQCLTHSDFGHHADMEPHQRLQHARLLAGYDSATDAANAIGVPVPTYAAHENGSRDFRRGRGGPIPGQRYAQFFKVSYDWLMTGRGEPKGRPATLDARAQALDPADQERLREYLELLESRATVKRAAG